MHLLKVMLTQPTVGTCSWKQTFPFPVVTTAALSEKVTNDIVSKDRIR